MGSVELIFGALSRDALGFILNNVLTSVNLPLTEVKTLFYNTFSTCQFLMKDLKNPADPMPTGLE